MLQAFTFYDAYLNSFYAGSPFHSRPFSQIRDELFRDGFSAVHCFAEDLPALGYETFLTVINDAHSQNAWMREHAPGVAHASRVFGRTGAYSRSLSDQQLAIFIEQINTFKPDVLYLDDPVSFDSRFIRMLTQRPRLVVGWRAASIPRDTDWREFDVIVSNHTPSLELARKHGARWQERFLPGFPQWIADEIAVESPSIDVAFTGSLSFEHASRVRILKELGTCAMNDSSDFSLAFFSDPSEKLPREISHHMRGAVWGMQMYRSLAKTKINLNIHIDLAKSEAANMRLFEATGVGAFLLTDDKPNIRNYFEPGREIETFQSVHEMVEKISYYLDHESERRAIAKRGQEKCLSCFGREKSSRHLDDIIRRALRAKSAREHLWPRLVNRLPSRRLIRPVPNLIDSP